MVSNIVNSAALAVLCVAAFLHLNKMNRETAGCERWAFVLIAAGSLGHALAYWWPWGGGDEVETLLHIGLALAGIAFMRNDLRAIVDRAAGKWDGIDRRGAR